MPEVADTRTPVTIPDMSDALADAWKLEMGAYPGIASLALLLAHWHLESGGGKSMVEFNVGNFKSAGNPGDTFCFFPTIEYEGDPPAPITHTPPDSTCRFVAYPSLVAGCQAYIHSLYTRWANAWHFVCTGDITSFSDTLYKDGYFSAPPQSYLAGLKARLPMVQGAAEHTMLSRVDTTPDTFKASTGLPPDDSNGSDST